MEATAAVRVLTISELINQHRPVTGASSLTYGCPVSHSQSNDGIPPSDEHRKPSGPTDQNPNPKILKPLDHPVLLIGTLNLPAHDNDSTSKSTPFRCSGTSCFSFSDGSSAVCCDVLDLDVRIIGKKIHVLAWNFIPFEYGSGFLEIIRWTLSESWAALSWCSSNFNVFPLFSGSSVDSKQNSKARYYIYGALESVSPVSVVSCKTGVSSNYVGSVANLCGFLVQILVCECQLCGSLNSVTALNNLIVGQYNHCFTKPVTVYFCGCASSWHPVVSKLIGNVVSLSEFTKKMVFIEREESHLMYVTTEKALLHLPKLPNLTLPKRKVDMKGKGELGTYMGTVTGIYMQGMVVELDFKVFLLLTDQQLDVPHSLRAGAIVSVKNVHFVNPRFSWMKTLILGSCCKTTICVKSFSPMETGCHLRSHSQSLLRKFIDSLTFPVRLWVLLVVSCFRKKFAGILSEKEILGSKHKEGLAQTYAQSRLPLSVSLPLHGVFMEYCRHESCGCGNDQNYGNLKLAVPISNFVSHCGATWIKILLEWDTCSDIMGVDTQFSRLSCNERSYSRPIKRILLSEDFDIVLLGKLKICPASARLQLFDATGSINVLIPDLPSNWSINSIYEVDDFAVVMEGIPEQVDHLRPSFNELFSCRSIFNGIPLPRQINFSLYLCYYLGNKQHRNRLFYPRINLKETIKELEGGRFHLLLVMHKFPVLQKFQGVKVVSSRPSAFAEAVILPWDLFIASKDGGLHSTKLSIDGDRNYWEFNAHKRCKIDQASKGPESFACNDSEYESYDHTKHCSTACSDLSYPLKIPCFVSGNYCSLACHGIFRYTQAKVKVGSDCKSAAWKVLLEYLPESFSKYESLRIGGYYLLKHYQEDTICSIKESNDFSGGKVVMTSEIHLWSVSFSFNEVKILGALTECAYPTGFGTGVYATFHRILVLGGRNEFVLTPTSFIVIDSVRVVNEHSYNGDCYQSIPLGSQNVAFSEKAPLSLISDITQGSDFKRMQFRCRVVAVYVLVLENAVYSCTKTQSTMATFNIPLAGFIMDDGSARCCCWTDNERALTLLRLREVLSHVACRNSCGSKTEMKGSYFSTIRRVNKILKQHGKILVRNYGSMLDSSCHDHIFSVGSDEVLSRSDEDLLKFILFNACFGTFQNIVGSVMNSNAIDGLKKHLIELEMRMRPLQDIWATEISYASPVAEARSIIQQLSNT